ncbi:hypothetical protein B0H21DRAFT_55980 [Amylocystis lapponica]|nr:hypothetical protein B0H21DRAFT_55980 [Amylocystis lapponica]
MSEITSVYKLLTVKTRSELPSRAPNLYVKVHLSDPQFNCKTTIKNHSYQPEWNEEFLLGDIKNLSSKVTLNLQNDSFIPFHFSLHPPSCGKVEVTLDSLLNNSNHKDLDLTRSKKLTIWKDLRWTLQVKLIKMDLRTAVEQTLENPQNIVSRVNDSLGGTDSGLFKTLGAVVSKLQVLDQTIKVIDSLAEVYPYVNLAWQVLSLVQRVLSFFMRPDKCLL